jgi:hypothetical protein
VIAFADKTFAGANNEISLVSRADIRFSLVRFQFEFVVG